MDVEAPGRANVPQRLEASALAADGQMSHPRSAIFRHAQFAQLIFGPEGAVEEQAVGPLGRDQDFRGQTADARQIDQDAMRASLADAEADVLASVRREPEALEVQRGLSRNGQRLHGESARSAVAL